MGRTPVAQAINVPHRLLKHFDFRPGEGVLFGLLAANAFGNALPLPMMKTAAAALFLTDHGSSALPYIYVAAAVLNPLASWAFLRIDKRMSFGRVLSVVAVAVIVIDLALRFGLAGSRPHIATALLPVWGEVRGVLASVATWPLVSRLFTVDQTKRLSGLVATGNTLGWILGGLGVPLLVPFIGTANVLVAATLCNVLVLILLRVIGARYQDRLAVAKSAPVRAGAVRAEDSDRRYTWLIVAFFSFSWIVYYFVDNLFYERAQARIGNADELASFIGLFFGLVDIGCFLAQVLLARYILRTRGLETGLLMLPSLALLGSFSALTAGLITGTGLILFLLVALMKIIDRVVRSSVAFQSWMVLLQPVPADQRTRLQTTTAGVVAPLAGGAAGLMLTVLTSRMGFGPIGLAASVVVASLVWVAITRQLGREYRVILDRALSARRVPPAELSIDDRSAGETIRRGLQSPHPGEALYSLGLLEQLAPSSLSDDLVAMLRHPSEGVRIEVLDRLARLGQSGTLSAVREALGAERAPSVRGAALRTLAILGGSDTFDEVQVALTDPEPLVRKGALTGLLRSGSIEGIVTAGQRLGDLVRSEHVAHRIFAAQLLGSIGEHGFHRPLDTLLGDHDLRVRRAALEACAHVRNPRLWPRVIDQLANPSLRGAASTALVAAGEPVVPLIEAASGRSGASSDWLVRAAFVCGRIGTVSAKAILWRLIEHPVVPVRHAALAALVSTGERATLDGQRKLVSNRIAVETDEAGATLAALADIEGAPEIGEMLPAALRRDLDASRDRLILLFAFVLDSKLVLRVRANYGSAVTARRAIAVELLDTLTNAELRPIVAALFGERPPGDSLRLLRTRTPQALVGAPQRLIEIAGSEAPATSRWTRVCAIEAASRLRVGSTERLLTTLAGSSDDLIRETASSSLRGGPGAPPQEVHVLTTLEKVMILKGVQIFAETPDEILAEVAGLLREVEVGAGDRVIEQGELGDCMYVIVDGEVALTCDGKRLATIGDREIFGEMSLLDSEPRSASVEALRSTHLLRLDQEELYDLMGQRVEIARGIIRLLSRRLRETDRKKGVETETPS